MILLSPVLDVVYYTWLLFVMFLAYVTILDAKERGMLSDDEIALCMIALAPGYIIDVLMNLIPMTVILWECPRWGEWTVTKRASRHCHHGVGRQHKIGKTICRFLNKFQRGGHCKP